MESQAKFTSGGGGEDEEEMDPNDIVQPPPTAFRAPAPVKQPSGLYDSEDEDDYWD